MTEYTPTTEEVGAAYREHGHLVDDHRYRAQGKQPLADSKYREEFDRWLNEIRAEAWDRGFDAGEADVLMHEVEGYDAECLKNPYRLNEK